MDAFTTITTITNFLASLTIREDPSLPKDEENPGGAGGNAYCVIA